MNNSSNQFSEASEGPERVEGKVAGRQEKRETTRSQIALAYVVFFMLTIIIVIGIGAHQKYKPDDYKDMLLTISGILSGPLGFIIGYYFKASSED